MERSFRLPSSRDGTPVHVMEWSPENRQPKALLQISHGVAEHIARYAPFARYMSEQGFVVFGNDHLGHGQTAGSPQEVGHVADQNGWTYLVDDMLSLMRQERAQYPDLPLFLLGHSMGSFLARTLVIRYPKEPLAGLVLTGTAHMPPVVSLFGQALFSVVRMFRGGRSLPVRLDRMIFSGYNKKFEPARTTRDWLTRDTDVVDAYVSDPLCGFTISTASYQELMKGLHEIAGKGRIRKMDPALPILIAFGSSDTVGACGSGPREVARRFAEVGITQMETILYPDARHEILNETCRVQVYSDILRWLEARLAKS